MCSFRGGWLLSMRKRSRTFEEVRCFLLAWGRGRRMRQKGDEVLCRVGGVEFEKGKKIG